MNYTRGMIGGNLYSSVMENYDPRTTISANSVRSCSRIIDNLYLTGKEGATETFDKYQLVVNCTADIQNKCSVRIPLDDLPENAGKMYDYLTKLNILEQINVFLSLKLSVMVHCMMGAQRSAAVVACYLVKYKKMTPDEAIKFIVQKRPIAFFGGNYVNFRKTIDLVYKDRLAMEKEVIEKVQMF